MLKPLSLALALSLLSGRLALAEDPRAEFLTRLFIDACIPNVGNPSGEEAWADAQHLTKVQDPAWLNVFAGPGKGSEAWTVPSSLGNFAVAIRGVTKACAVYAQSADPTEVQTNFERLVGGVARPGIVKSTIKDTISPVKGGQAHTLAYDIKAEGASSSHVFMMIAVDHPGGLFQVELEAAKATAK